MFMAKRGFTGGDFYVDIDNVALVDAASVTSVEKYSTVIYPNPVQGKEILLKNIPEDHYKWKIISTEGKNAVNGEAVMRGEYKINGEYLNPGMYFLQLEGVRNNYLMRFVVNN